MGTAKRKWLCLVCLRYMARGVYNRGLASSLPLSQCSFRNDAANSQPTNRLLSAFSNGPATTLLQTSTTPTPSTLNDGLTTPHPSSPPIVGRQCNLSVSVPEIALAKSKPLGCHSIVLRSLHDFPSFLMFFVLSICPLHASGPSTIRHPLARSSLAAVHQGKDC